MRDESAVVASSYLQHLSDEDLRLLAAATPGLTKEPDVSKWLRGRPELVVDLLARASSFELVFPDQHRDPGAAPHLERPGEALFSSASPFLIFAVAVHETHAELERATYVEEWLGPKHRTPIFQVDDLRGFLASPLRRLFLAELLASYTHVSSGSVLLPTRRGLRRRRFSELDPVRLAELLQLVSEPERPGILRRLGDLALFLTGVFPDHTATHGLSAVEEGRLLRSVHLRPAAASTPSIPGFGDASTVQLFERLGRRWYQLAYESLPRPVPADVSVLAELNERFGEARRILNVVTDRYLFPFRQQWFGIESS